MSRNITFLIEDLSSGGAQRQVINLVKELALNPNNVCKIIVFFKDDFFKEELENTQINVVNIGNDKLMRFIRLYFQVDNRSENYLISFLSNANFYAQLVGLVKPRLKVICSERSANPDFGRGLYPFVLRMFYPNCHKIVFNSVANLKLVDGLLPASYKRNNWKVLPNFYNLPIKINEFLNDNNVIRISIAARVNEVKNPLMLLEAINMHKNLLKGKLVIDWYGKPKTLKDIELEDKCLQFVKANALEDIIAFKGLTKDMEAEIISSDFVALFSSYEGMPNSAIEAMLHGTPVLLTKVSDNEKYIKHLESGYLLECNLEGISEALIWAMSTTKDTRIKMGNSARLSVSSQYNYNVLDEWIK